ELRIADDAAHELVALVPGERRQVGEVARIRELVEVHDALAGRSDSVEDEIGADETGAAGHENRHAEEVLCSSRSLRYLRNVAWQPMSICAKPAAPSRKPRRTM